MYTIRNVSHVLFGPAKTGGINSRVKTALVVNPGTHPEPLALAMALARQGFSVEYMSGSQIAASHPAARLATHFVRGGLGTRELPGEVEGQFSTHSRGLLLELAYVVSRRIRGIDSAALLRLRTTWVSHAAGRLAMRRQSQGSPFTIIVGQQTAAFAAFRNAPSSTKVLMQPIVSQGWLERELARDAIRRPEWAFSLQGQARHHSQARHIFEEADLADVFVSASELVARSLQEDGYGPVIVSPYGVARSAEPVRIRPQRQLTVLFVGQVNQRKGIGYLCEAMTTLRARMGQEVGLRIAGPMDPRVDEAIRRKAPYAEVLGPLSRTQVDAEYSSCDVLVLPSLAEGFALVVLEAMAHGLPCVVTDRTGAHEVIEDGVNGVVVPAADSDALAEGLYRLLIDDGCRERMGRAARDTARSLSWERFGDAVARELTARSVSSHVAESNE